MSYNYGRRRASSPRTPDRTTNGYFAPVAWKTASRKHGYTVQKIVQYTGVGVMFVVIIALLAGLLEKPSHEPMRVERNPKTNFFEDWEGDKTCGLSTQQLYSPPITDGPNTYKDWPFCGSRKQITRAMSNGGRFGFDKPYTPDECQYKWYSSQEICMILERFDTVVFVGDDMVASIYAAFTMLMRRNLAYGALEQWRMEDKDFNECQCRQQFTNPECAKFFSTASHWVVSHDGESSRPSPFVCSRIPHRYFKITGSASDDFKTQFHDILWADHDSWKPIGIIHSLGLSSGFNWQTATESIDEWLSIADESGRNSPFLWLGPNAAGHLKSPNRIMQEGNNALWHYSLLMANEARRRGVEALNNYNMTLQASSFDGSHYDERVALVQAMMVINWLAHVETT